LRLVADMIRGQKVVNALALLRYDSKAASINVEKLLKSAVANWSEKNKDLNIDSAELVVKAISVDCGKMLKRLRPAPQGRAYRVRKRSNHITIVVDSSINA